LGRAQHGANQTTVAVEHHDRRKAMPVVVGIEHAQLLLAMGGIEVVVDVEHDPSWHLAEAVAVEIDHAVAHAQQATPVRQGLQPRDRRLRAQWSARRQAPHRQLEHGIVAQNIGIVAVLIAGGDHQHAEADNVLERMHHLRGLARIGNVRGQAGRDAEALLDFAQCQQTATGGEAFGIEGGDDRLVRNR
jgi:hypothetical protein